MTVDPSSAPPVPDPMLVADPVLVACAHGTASAAGRRAVGLLRLDASRLRPGTEVLAAHVDVQKPALDDVVSDLVARGRRFVVVPLLLAGGYHVHVDIRRAVQGSGGLGVAAGALGPDPELVDLLASRLAVAGRREGDGVVLGAAGSSDPRAGRDVEAVASLLAARLGAPVEVGYLSASRPGVDEAVGTVRARGARRVVVASYLLAPGFFADRLARCGADAVTDPLAPDGRLARVVVRRYEAALREPLPHPGH